MYKMFYYDYWFFASFSQKIGPSNKPFARGLKLLLVRGDNCPFLPSSFRFGRDLLNPEIVPSSFPIFISSFFGTRRRLSRSSKIPFRQQSSMCSCGSEK